MYPPGIVTRTCTVGGATAQESGDPLILSVVVASSRGLIWASTGWRLPSLPRLIASTVGSEATFELPVTSQAGFRSDSSPGTIIDVSAPGSYSHTYTATVTITTPTGGLVSQSVIGPFPLPAEDLSPVDLDTMLPVGAVAGGAVLVPDSWSARLDALEAGGGGGGGVTVRRVTLNGSHVVDTSTWNTDQAQTVVFTQGGAGGNPVYHQDAPVDVAAAGATVTAWVWTGAEWRWFSDAATAEVVVDETPPTAGNLQLGVAPTTITATTQGAMDETALHPQPFRFAIATAASSGAWSDAQWRAAMGAWQSSDTASFEGLSMGTAYNVCCEVRDMAGNARLTAVASGTTTVTVEPTTYYEASFTAADGTVLSAYTPDVGGQGTISSTGTIFGNALWTVPNPDWHSGPNVTTPTPALKLIRWTLDYDLTTGGPNANVNVDDHQFTTMAIKKTGNGVEVGPDIAFGGTLVSSEVSPTAPVVPHQGRAIIEFEGTPGVWSNWVCRVYIVVDDEPVLHTTVVVNRNLAAVNHRYGVSSSEYQGTPGVVGTQLSYVKLEGVPL